MSRVIKFRAWDYEEKVMLPWDEIKLFSALALGQGAKGRYFMQFTGLTDKNGKEIYEGDVAQFPISGDEFVTGQVVIELQATGIRDASGAWQGQLHHRTSETEV